MAEPAIHFWDMDHTLIDNDCDVSWKEFLVGRGLAAPDALEQNDFFYEQYKRGELDFEAFIRFQLAEFRGKTLNDLQPLVEAHYKIVVRPLVYAQARERVKRQIRSGARVVLLTATNGVIAAPLAVDFGFPELIATEPEMVDGVFTGDIVPPYCGGVGKLEHLARRCAALGISLADAAYYGDSKTDIPVLEGVGHPICCNPAAALEDVALERHWPILRF